MNPATPSLPQTSNRRRHLPDQFVLRILMVLGGMAPLFILWAIRGSCLISVWNFWIITAGLVILPNAYVYWRIVSESKARYGTGMVIASLEDRKDGVLIYLVSILLPFYSSSLDNWSELISSVSALIFIMSVFIYLDLHYVNILFAFTGFSIFLIRSEDTTQGLTKRRGVILITKQKDIREGEIVRVRRITSKIFVERQ